jgi:hypothetical protein
MIGSSPPPSPSSSAAAQWVRKTPRTPSGLIPNSFKRAMAEAASPKEWTKLPPRPTPEKFRYRGDYIVAARNKKKAEQRKYPGAHGQGQSSSSPTPTPPKRTPQAEPQEKKEWDFRYSGDAEVYRLTLEEEKAREKLRKESNNHLKQMALERKEQERLNPKKTIIKPAAVITKVKEASPRKPLVTRKQQENTSRQRIGTATPSSKHGQKSHHPPTLHSKLVQSKADFAKAASKRSPAAKASARIATLSSMQAAAKQKESPRPSVIKVGDDDVSVLSDGMSFSTFESSAYLTEDRSVQAAKEALEYARARLAGMGLLQSKNKKDTSERDRAVAPGTAKENIPVSQEPAKNTSSNIGLPAPSMLQRNDANNANSTYITKHKSVLSSMGQRPSKSAITQLPISRQAFHPTPLATNAAAERKPGKGFIEMRNVHAATNDEYAIRSDWMHARSPQLVENLGIRQGLGRSPKLDSHGFQPDRQENPGRDSLTFKPKCDALLSQTNGAGRNDEIQTSKSRFQSPSAHVLPPSEGMLLGDGFVAQSNKGPELSYHSIMDSGGMGHIHSHDSRGNDAVWTPGQTTERAPSSYNMFDQTRSPATDNSNIIAEAPTNYSWNRHSIIQPTGNYTARKPASFNFVRQEEQECFEVSHDENLSPAKHEEQSLSLTLPLGLGGTNQPGGLRGVAQQRQGASQNMFDANFFALGPLFTVNHGTPLIDASRRWDTNVTRQNPHKFQEKYTQQAEKSSWRPLISVEIGGSDEWDLS